MPSIAIRVLVDLQAEASAVEKKGCTILSTHFTIYLGRWLQVEGKGSNTMSCSCS
jgi:hypothetical protein